MTTKKAQKDSKTKKNIQINKEKNNFIKTLGIDLSIGKVKLCLVIYDKETKNIGGGWSSLPVNFKYVSDKQYDYLEGLSIAIEAFLEHHNTKSEEIKSIIFCTGGGYYMASSFGEGMRYTASIIKMIFPKQKVHFIRVDGELIHIDDIFELDNSEASAFGCTNYLGTSLLAMKNFSDGLAIDMGTISTSIIPIMDNKIDPIASYNPKGYMLHRYTTGKHIWFGVMHTSLIHITNTARTRKANYNLILRSCSTNTLCTILGIVEPSVVNVHVNDSSKIAELEMAYMKMAETVGLDIYSISQEELYEIAKDIYFQMVRKLSDNVRNILANMNYKDFSDLKVLAAGLGQEAFIIPSLMSCGFEKEQIITITEDKQSNLWTATSVYGLAILALENIIGEKVNVSID